MRCQPWVVGFEPRVGALVVLGEGFKPAIDNADVVVEATLSEGRFSVLSCKAQVAMFKVCYLYLRQQGDIKMRLFCFLKTASLIKSYRFRPAHRASNADTEKLTTVPIIPKTIVFAIS